LICSHEFIQNGNLYFVDNYQQRSLHSESKHAGRRMGKKRKKQRKETQTDEEKIIEEDKAYSTMEREQDF